MKEEDFSRRYPLTTVLDGLDAVIERAKAKNYLRKKGYPID